MGVPPPAGVGSPLVQWEGLLHPMLGDHVVVWHLAAGVPGAVATDEPRSDVDGVRAYLPSDAMEPERAEVVGPEWFPATIGAQRSHVPDNHHGLPMSRLCRVTPFAPTAAMVTPLEVTSTRP